MERKPLERRVWFVAMNCVVALLVTWWSFWVVFEAIPPGHTAAFWGLQVLALGSTAGLIFVLERALPPALIRWFPNLQR